MIKLEYIRNKYVTNASVTLGIFDSSAVTNIRVEKTGNNTKLEKTT